MRRLILTMILAIACTTVQAQLYVPGETLHYRMGYKAKLFPLTEVAKVIMQTTETTLDGEPVYKVYGYGETAKAWSSEDAKGFIKVTSTALRAYYLAHPDEER